MVRYTEKYLEKRDQRLRLTGEIFAGIRDIKMAGVEPVFFHKVTEARDEELIYIKKSKYIIIIQIFWAWITPVLMSVAAFGLYTLAGYELTAEKIFVTLGAFDVIKVQRSQQNY
jgi:ABC transporter transmembrane region.